MAKTKKLAMELPQEGRFISAEFPILRENLTIIDQAVSDLDEKLDNKAPSQHTHVMSEVSELEDVLNGKMAVDKTFALVDLTDVKGARDAAENHVLYKSGEDHFVFGDPTSLLGEHQHTIEDITGLEEYIESISLNPQDYGRLKEPNRWEDTNIFKGNINTTMGISFGKDASFIIKGSAPAGHERPEVTKLTSTESLLKGPLKVDGELVCTEKYLNEEVVKLTDQIKKLEAEVKKLKDELTGRS